MSSSDLHTHGSLRGVILPNGKILRNVYLCVCDRLPSWLCPRDVPCWSCTGEFFSFIMNSTHVISTGFPGEGQPISHRAKGENKHLNKFICSMKREGSNHGVKPEAKVNGKVCAWLWAEQPDTDNREWHGGTVNRTETGFVWGKGDGLQSRVRR